MTLKLAIAGAKGRMGQALARAIAEREDLTLAGATERESGGELAPGVAIVSDVRAAAQNADVWLDFTTPAATIAALSALEATGVRAAIVGTTGLSGPEEAAIASAARRIAVVRAGNFSLGVTLLEALVEQAAARLPDWDVEILEAHHRRKVDAPSGTALALGHAVARARNAVLAALRVPARDGITGPRKTGEIGFASLRAGAIVGEHEVLFASERETLRLAHQAQDRAVFADGALIAARWAAQKPPGLYSMRDVLGL